MPHPVVSLRLGMIGRVGVQLVDGHDRVLLQLFELPFEAQIKQSSHLLLSKVGGKEESHRPDIIEF